VQLLHASTVDLEIPNDPFGLIPGPLYLFRGHSAGDGHELWSTDGTPGGTNLLLDINPGPSDSFPTFKRMFAGKYLISATTSSEGANLYVSDGTSIGTLMLNDLAPGPDDSPVGRILATENYFYFFAGIDSGNNKQLYRSDGTPQGTVPMFSLITGPDYSQSFMVEDFLNYIMATATNSYHVVFTENE